jgi:hypothetical protein
MLSKHMRRGHAGEPAHSTQKGLVAGWQLLGVPCRDGGREASRQGGREASRQGGRPAGKEGGREVGREGGRWEGGKEGAKGWVHNA